MPEQHSKRIHSMDALRAIAMLLGIVLHVSIAYRITPLSPWPADDKIHSIFYDYLYLFLHSFRMQLFYLIAGFFARLLYLKIGKNAFIRHRFKRIAWPLFVGLLTIAPLSMIPFIYYGYGSLHPELGFMEVMKNINSYIFQWNGMAHLWFLYYLIFYYITMIILLSLVKSSVLGVLKKGVDFIYKKIILFPKIGSILVLIIPVSAILCLFPQLPVEPYTGLTPKIPLYLYYGFFFFLGYTIHRYYINQLNVFTENAISFFIIGITMVPLVWHFCYLPDNGNAPVIMYLFIRFLAASQTIFLLFGFLGVFLKFSRSESHILRYISDASYWMYLIHMPIVVWMQIWFIDSVVPPLLRFWIINVATIGICMITYALFVRYTFIGKVLNGPRKRKEAGKIRLALRRFPFVSYE